MVRKAALTIGLLAATPAFAQSSTTNCHKDYFGNITCQTQQNGGIDWSRANQGQIMQSGANVVPNYAEQQMRRREMELRERELRLREQALKQAETPPPPPASPPQVSDAERQAFLDNMLNYCPRDGSPVSTVAMPDDRRAVITSLCYAFERGRIIGNAQGRQ